MSRLVLIADGDHERAQRVAAACADLDLPTRITTHGAAALEIALAEVPAVLAAQIRLPLIDGAQLGEILRTNPCTRSVELVFLPDSSIEAGIDNLPGEVIPLAADADDTARVIQTLAARYATSVEEQDPADDDAGVEGQLSQLPLADLLQLFHVSRKTGTVVVRRDGPGGLDAGSVVLREGDIVHAEVGAVVGAKALYRLLAWKRGDFSFRPGESSDEPTIDKPTRALLREGVRQLNEWARIAVNLPPMDAEVRLKIRRESLPIVIHPLTQEVLLVLEAYARVGDVVEHCSFPDYQVLRTLHTLIRRGMVEVRRDPAFGSGTASNLFSAARGARLREWLGVDTPGGTALHDAKLLVVPSDEGATLAFGRLLAALPGADLAPGLISGDLARTEVASLGRLSVDEEVGLEFVHMPADDRFAPLWPLGGHGAVGILFLLSGSVSDALRAVKSASEAMRQLPRARIFHLLLLEKGAGVEPDALRENLSIFDESSLFLIPLDNDETAEVLLREMFGRILP